MSNKGWSEQEVRKTVESYFQLLQSEVEGESVNKAKLFDKLSKKFPERTTRAFESKFQNISDDLPPLNETSN